MAQTTRPASFGPVLVVITFLLIPCRVFLKLQPIYKIKHSLVLKKKRQREKKKRRNCFDFKKTSKNQKNSLFFYLTLGAVTP